MTRQTVLFLGARSDIAMAAAHTFARSGYAIRLAARDVVRLTSDKADLALRYGADVTMHEFDVLDLFSMRDFVASLPEIPDVVVCAIGTLGDETLAKRDSEELVRMLRVNFEGPAVILSILADCMAERRSGTIIAISSVAGERGRYSNYIYGAAKAGFTTFLSGLRAAMWRSNVHVITILPGFVKTRMTQDLVLPPFVTARPEEVAKVIFRSAVKRHDVVYVRWVWRPLMAIIRALPEPLFKRLKF